MRQESYQKNSEKERCGTDRMRALAADKNLGAMWLGNRVEKNQAAG
jgi:hypothetical protein